MKKIIIILLGISFLSFSGCTNAEVNKDKAMSDLSTVLEVQNSASDVASNDNTENEHNLISLIDGEKTSISLLRAGNPITIDKYESPNQLVLLDYITGDFTGDGIDDIAFVIGESTNSILKDNISFMLQDGSSNRFIFFNDGYMAAFVSLSKANISNKSRFDCIMHLDYGGNGGAGTHSFNIFSFDGKQISEIFFSDYNIDDYTTDFKVEFEDNYKIRVYSQSMNYEKKFSLISDLKKEKSRYDSVYDEKGNLTEPVESGAESIYSIDTVDTDNDGLDELLSSQYVPGFGRSDCLGDFHVLWKYINGRFSAQKCIFKPYDGTELDPDPTWYRNDTASDKNNN